MSVHVFVADVHVGNPRRFGGEMRLSMNDRCRMILATLRGAYQIAKKHEAASFNVLGDLFDNPNPNPRMVAAVQEIFSIDDEMTRRVILGNHDPNSTERGDHALAPLWDHVDVIEGAEVIELESGLDMIAVPYGPGPLEDRIPLTKSRGGILVFHAGISDSRTPQWLLGHGDSIAIGDLRKLMERRDISRAFCGHWHNHQIWDSSQIVQIGALCPTGWNNPGHTDYGRVLIYDADSNQVTYSIVPGPRFIQVRVAEDSDDWKLMGEATAKAQSDGNILFLQMIVPMDRVAEFMKIKNEHQGRYHVVDIIPDRTDAEVAARNAAQATKSVDSLAEAVVAYGNNMSLAEGVSRKGVIRQIRRYLNV